MRTCSICGLTVLEKEPCRKCQADALAGRDVSEMSVEERVEELLMWVNAKLEIPFADLDFRVSKLVGRPIFTHEYAEPELLVEEIRRGQPADGNEVFSKLERLANGKPIITFVSKE